MAELLMQTPLNGQHQASEGLSIKELGPCTRISVRGNMEALSPAIEKVTGISATAEPNTYVSLDANTLFWLGPDERLIYSDSVEATTLVNRLREEMPAGQSAVVDISDYYTVIEVAGAKASAALASGTPFDLHQRVFGPGQCAQTRFGNASVLLVCKSHNTFDVQVRWSFAEYVWKYLWRVGNYV